MTGARRARFSSGLGIATRESPLEVRAWLPSPRSPVGPGPSPQLETQLLITVYLRDCERLRLASFLLRQCNCESNDNH